MKTEEIDNQVTGKAISTFRCPVCSHEKIQTTLTKETFTYGVGDSAIQIDAMVPVRTCENCDYRYTDDEAMDLRHEAVCRRLGVLTPGEIVALREKSGLTLAALAELAGVEEATLQRWEQGAIIQNTTVDQLLYLLQFEDNIQRLRDRAGQTGSARKPETETIMKPILDGRAWLGKAEAYGTTFIVELFESRQNPGYYHFAMYCADDSFCDESKKPMRVKDLDGVNFWTFFNVGLSKEHGLVLNDFIWVECKPEELPLSGKRAKAGA